MKLYYHQLAQTMADATSQGYWIAGEPWVLNQDAKEQIKRQWMEQGHEPTSVYIENQEEAHAWLNSLQTPTLFQSQRLWSMFLTKPNVSFLIQALSKQSLIPQDKLILQTVEPIPRGVRCPSWLHQVAIYPLFDNQVVPWVQRQLKQHQLSASSTWIQSLIRLSNHDLLVLQQMIEKISMCFQGTLNEAALSILHENPDVDVQQMESHLLAANDSTKDWIDRLLRKNVPLPLILWYLTRFTRTMLSLADALAHGISLKDALTQARIPTFKLLDYKKSLEHGSHSYWLVCLKLCGLSDRLVKTSQLQLAQDVIKDLFLSIAYRRKDLLIWLQRQYLSGAV